VSRHVTPLYGAAPTPLGDALRQVAAAVRAVAEAVDQDAADKAAERPVVAAQAIPAVEPLYLTYKQAGARLGIHASTVANLVKQGKLPVVSFGPQSPRIPATALAP